MRTHTERGAAGRTPYTGWGALVACLVALVAACGEGAPSDGSTAGGETLFGIPTEAEVEVGTTPGARLEPLVEAVNFGPLWEGAERSVRFPLVSTGTEPASIQLVKASCGCTHVATVVVQPDGTERVLERGEALAPGTRVEVAVRFDSRGLVGPENKFVTVYGDFPNGKLDLEVAAETRPFLIREPLQVQFDRVFAGANASQSAQVRAADGEPFELALATELPAGLAVELERAADGKSYTVTARLAPGIARGPLLSEIVLVSDRPFPDAGDLTALGVPPAVHAEGAKHYTTLPVGAVVVGAVEPVSPVLEFGFVLPDVLTSRTARFECYDPALRAAFLAATPELTFGASAEGAWPEGFEGAFEVTWRAVEEPAAGELPLTKGAVAAWDAEIALTGRRGGGFTRVFGEAEARFGAELPAQRLNFQVILQP